MNGWNGILPLIPVLNNRTPVLVLGIANLGDALTSNIDTLIPLPDYDLLYMDQPWRLGAQMWGHTIGTLSRHLPSQRGGARYVYLCMIIYYGVPPPGRAYSQLCLSHIQVGTDIGITCILDNIDTVADAETWEVSTTRY